MTTDKLHLRLHPHGRDIAVTRGDKLLTALYENNIFLRTDCGGKGVCGKCKVEIIGEDNSRETVNCCTVHVEQNLTVEIPVSSMVSPEVITKAPVQLPAKFREEFVPSDSGCDFGIAVDLGTTTIAIYLVQVKKAEIIASLSLKNPQAIYGDDVMSRIGGIFDNESNQEHLQSLVVKTIELGMDTLFQKNGRNPDDISEMVVVGNPAMIHLFLGVNPQTLGLAPYRPAFTEARQTPAAQLGFTFKNVTIHTLPQVSGFIGGDLLSAALAADIANSPTGTLLIDIGTNGEIILKADLGLHATSCATGPAFEGATLSCGMQAVSGAIDAIKIASAEISPEYTILSSAKNGKKVLPAGICGSGIISGVAELLRRGIVVKSGAFDRSRPIESLQNNAAGSPSYMLYSPTAGTEEEAVYISQADIRAIQLGKGALFTGIEFLMKKAGITELHQIIIAGAFGSHLDKQDMMTLGLIPVLEPSRIITAGNLAGAGAVMALCDKRYRQSAEQLASEISVLELTTDPAFQQVFIERLQFPEL